MKNNEKFLLLCNCFLVLFVMGEMIKLHNLSTLTFTLFFITAYPLYNIINKVVTNKNIYIILLSTITIIYIFFSLFLLIKENMIGFITMLSIACMYGVFLFYKKEEINIKLLP